MSYGTLECHESEHADGQGEESAEEKRAFRRAELIRVQRADSGDGPAGMRVMVGHSLRLHCLLLPV